MPVQDIFASSHVNAPIATGPSYGQQLVGFRPDGHGGVDSARPSTVNEIYNHIFDITI